MKARNKTNGTFKKKWGNDKTKNTFYLIVDRTDLFRLEKLEKMITTFHKSNDIENILNESKHQAIRKIGICSTECYVSYYKPHQITKDCKLSQHVK
jgi:hypothetical protein